MLHKEIRPSKPIQQVLGVADMQYIVDLPLGSRGNWDKVIEWLNKNRFAHKVLKEAYDEYAFTNGVCAVTKESEMTGIMPRVNLGPVGGPKVRASFRTLMYMMHTYKVVLTHPTCGCRNCVNPYHQKEVGGYTPTVRNLKDKLDAAKQET